MKYIILGFLLLTSMQAEIDKKWSSNKNCEACHKDISKHWETSRHANSHFSKNDLFKKTLEYMVLKTPKLILDEVKVKCAKCHNPRISKTTVSGNEKMLLALEVDSTKKEFNQALNAEHMKNGINCIVCHNIEEIHLDKSIGSQGLEGVKFGQQGTMFGPFNNAKSPYHKTEYKEHFSDNSPTLCFSCHYSHKNDAGLEVYATGKEYDSVASTEGCKSCHMGKKREGIASNYSKAGEKPKARMVRDHHFASVDNSNILNDNVETKSYKESDSLIVELKNNSPHSIPTGYGLRELIISVEFYNSSKKMVDRQIEVLAAVWKDKGGEDTVPFAATTLSSDNRLAANSSKKYHFTIPDGANSAKYILSYRFINQKMAKKIGITDPFFLKEYSVKESTLSF
ncbi:MAG: multiheme c-type cytochrome [Campylobacterota bacterium]|nr:multiheme c-type cytochrome [Campylobacterota bacterium]